jgi:alkanesulfonate monooxygenase SsuD/methylene tetrahydromethanopterin reductase-like flavin-dependent oxidoreductase (luciferase family)
MTRYFYAAGHEQFSPRELLTHAVAAEQAGFDGVAASDHPALRSGERVAA